MRDVTVASGPVADAITRIANEEQLTPPWRIHALVADFTLEDVWELPEVSGTRNDFDRVVELAARFHPARAGSRPTRFLWGARDLLGRWFDLGRISVPVATTDRVPTPQIDANSLIGRLPAELRGTADDVRFEQVPFVPLYRTRDEFAAEMSNRTVHGVMHLTWAPSDGNAHRLRMAVYVNPRGVFGHAYMRLIKPFRYAIVYPAPERQFERAFNRTAERR